MSRQRTSLALLRLALKQQLRGARWFVGGLIFALVMVSARVWSSTPQQLFGYAMIAACVLALHFGIADDGATGFNRLLPNFADDWLVLGSRFTAAVICLLGFFVFAFALAALLWQDARLAGWYVAFWLLVVWLVVPVSLVIELATRIRMPASLAFLLLMGGLLIAQKIAPFRAGAYLGLGASAGSFAGLKRLTVINLTWNLLPFIAAGPLWLRHSRE